MPCSWGSCRGSIRPRASNREEAAVGKGEHRRGTAQPPTRKPAERSYREAETCRCYTRGGTGPTATCTRRPCNRCKCPRLRKSPPELDTCRQYGSNGGRRCRSWLCSGIHSRPEQCIRLRCTRCSPGTGCIPGASSARGARTGGAATGAGGERCHRRHKRGALAAARSIHRRSSLPRMPGIAH